MAKLYIVSTPIGNRQDISLRALSCIKKLKYLLCEDTRKTQQLLEFFKIHPLPKLISFYEQNERQRMFEILNILMSGENVGLVSNAGTPLLSDPGFKLVRECVNHKITVRAIPGASALLTGLVTSGLPMDKFMYLGFLPKKQGRKEKLIEKAKNILEILPLTMVIYESPFRVSQTLAVIYKYIPECRIVICRELTKKFEEVLRGSPTELMAKLGQVKVKGELVILISTISS